MRFGPQDLAIGVRPDMPGVQATLSLDTAVAGVLQFGAGERMLPRPEYGGARAVLVPLARGTAKKNFGARCRAKKIANDRNGRQKSRPCARRAR